MSQHMNRCKYSISFAKILGWWCTYLACLSIGILVSATTGKAQTGAFRFSNAKAKSVTVPIDLQRNMMLVKLILNGKGPYTFMLDTGVGVSLITDPHLQSELHLQKSGKIRLVGLGEETALEVYKTQPLRVELPGIVAPELTMMCFSDDVLDLSSYVGVPIHGILGRDIFQSFIIEIRANTNQIVLHHPKKFKTPYKHRWEQIPLDIEGDKAYIQAQVTQENGESIPLKLVLDTGAGHALSLETKSDARLQLPEKRLRTQLGRGLSGYINGYLGRVTSLSLGRYKLNNLISSFPDYADVGAKVETYRNGNIGLESLKRFNIILDYPHNLLALQPNTLFKDPFEHDMCGLDLVATGADFQSFIIVKVQPQSPAAEALLQPGDQLISINMQPASAYTLTKLSRLLHSGDGHRILFVVRRSDGELITAIVKLKRQI